MLGHYLTKHPAIYDTIMDMIDEYREVVNEYNDSVGLQDIAARILRPDDQIIGKAAEVYEGSPGRTYLGDSGLLSLAGDVPPGIQGPDLLAGRQRSESVPPQNPLDLRQPA